MSTTEEKEQIVAGGEQEAEVAHESGDRLGVRGRTAEIGFHDG